MATVDTTATQPASAGDAAALFHDAAGGVPIELVRDGAGVEAGGVARRWLEATRFAPTPKRVALVPGADGALASVRLGLGSGEAGEPCGPSELLVGALPVSLPPGDYRLAEDATRDPERTHLAALAWGLGAYRYRRYKTLANGVRVATTVNGAGNSGRLLADVGVRLAWPAGVDRARLLAEIEAVHHGRDLINTPASDLGPAELETAVRQLAARYGADVMVVTGDDLLARNFPLIHAVGRASSRAPRLIDLMWGHEGARRITLVGKGIVFDTGGLDIKPSSGMLLMKKDMGGAAVALTVAQMIMAMGLPVRLRLLIAAAENAISGDAFRPGDVIASRLGPTVEIGNTDAEGRLVLADALALADEEGTDTIFTFATLTGAARVALGADLPALFTDDDALAVALMEAGRGIGDPMWRMPLWPGYERALDSEVADMGNVADGPFAGAIMAALFLRRFVRRAPRFAHLDLYGWRPTVRALGPKGGEPQTARAVVEVLRRETGV